MKKQTGNGKRVSGVECLPRSELVLRRGRLSRALPVLALLAVGTLAGTAQGWEPSLLATGGDTTKIYTNDFVIYGCHSFTNVGSANFTPLVDNLTVQYLVIGGGGGGAVQNTSPWYGGGGGAGGYRCSVPGELSGSNTTAEAATNPTDTTPVPVFVGAGGEGGTGSGASGTAATNGQDSSFGSIVATGGGRGGSYSWGPGTGGSGGGGSGSAGQANTGGGGGAWNASGFSVRSGLAMA